MTRKRKPSLGVVDRDTAFRVVLEKRLASVGWDFVSLSGRESTAELIALKLNALLVEPSAVEEDFWEYLREICSALPGLGLLVCSSDSTVAQRVKGLRLGADDWLRRPAHPEEVVARLEAIVRRKQRHPGRLEPRSITAGPLDVRPDEYQALIDGRSVGLTKREFEVLHVLSSARGQVIERDEIYHRVWGYAMAHGDRSVDVFVRKLRQKLETDAEWRYIHTHHGVGYRFEPVRNKNSQVLHTEATAA